MEVKKLYQTIEDTGDYEKILQDGPFPCTIDGAWLGEGYYFWDTLERNAHWWGQVHYVRFGRSFLITSGNCDFEQEKCLDLHNDLVQLIDIEKVYYRILDETEEKEIVTVSRVIEYLKKSDKFPYHCIRASGIFVKTEKKNRSKYPFVIPFEKNKDRKLLDLCPPVQICIIDKKLMNFRDYEIIDNFDNEMELNPSFM